MICIAQSPANAPTRHVWWANQYNLHITDAVIGPILCIISARPYIHTALSMSIRT